MRCKIFSLRVDQDCPNHGAEPPPFADANSKKRFEFSRLVLSGGVFHNHPSGDPSPSKADIEMTREIARAASTLGIAVPDHIIVGRQGYTSLKSIGVI